jgi:DNA polymerase II
MSSVEGFIVSAWDERPHGTPAQRRLFATGRLTDGRSFAVVMPAAAAALYVPVEHGERAAELLRQSHGARLGTDAWSTFDGTTVARIELAHGRPDDAERRVTAALINVRQVEWSRASDALLALGITGPVEIRGAATAGRRVDAVFVAPELAPSTSVPALGWLALDIETTREDTVVAVSLAGVGGAGEVLFVTPAPLSSPTVTSVATERDLLAALAARIRVRDPDVLTGWNVIDFDLAVLARRFAAHSIPFDIGRVPGTVDVRTRTSGKLSIDIPGRAVIDAMRLVRASAERIEDQTLDGAAHALLGGGKTVPLRGAAKLAELDRLRAEEPAAFCAYCLRDSELVLEILRVTGLDALTVRRAALTGVSLELAWTSIPAFERVYGAALRARNILQPVRVEHVVDGAAGGTVLEAEAGLFSNVLVFDFRSLYPSLMRTFHIDPLAHARAMSSPRTTDIVAPNAARFDRTEGILPKILTAYTREREAALAAGDETAAYVYKILQNSFYGVLGSSGCRYGRTELAGAITSFGKHFLTTARDWFEARGHHVLYGDTDSVFVQSGLDDSADHATITQLAAVLADDLNAHITAEIRDGFNVESYLRIRCDKIYRRFFISRLRGDSSSEGRGRGKGYAGLRLDTDDSTEVEVKGMEAARSDFTPLARRFQVELMRQLFAGASVPALRNFCSEIAGQLARGELDDQLVYRKVLRRPAAEYESETPQVRAARLLGWADRGGPIEYVMTRAGAEPIEARTTATLDYGHYRDRQLMPIAQAVANVLGTEIDGWFGEPGQLGLFARE